MLPYLHLYLKRQLYCWKHWVIARSSKHKYGQTLDKLLVTCARILPTEALLLEKHAKKPLPNIINKRFLHIFQSDSCWFKKTVRKTSLMTKCLLFFSKVCGLYVQLYLSPFKIVSTIQLPSSSLYLELTARKALRLRLKWTWFYISVCEHIKICTELRSAIAVHLNMLYLDGAQKWYSIL